MRWQFQTPEGAWTKKKKTCRRPTFESQLADFVRVCLRVCSRHTQKLEKLSAQSCPSRDRLVVFSDVFDDVCEGSPVFGRILREIKVFPFPLHPLAHF